MATGTFASSAKSAIKLLHLYPHNAIGLQTLQRKSKNKSKLRELAPPESAFFKK
jgi:hypothetical protein